jgi:hypothetical protein
VRGRVNLCAIHGTGLFLTQEVRVHPARQQLYRSPRSVDDDNERRLPVRSVIPGDVNRLGLLALVRLLAVLKLSDLAVEACVAGLVALDPTLDDVALLTELTEGDAATDSGHNDCQPDS